MLYLRVLGTLSVRRPDGSTVDPLLSQPKRAALLVYLAVARPRGFHQRDALLPLFWPESDEASARHALSQALYALRSAIGEEVLDGTGQGALAVRPGSLSCDAWEFESAVERGEWALALDRYRGGFLTGFHLSGVGGFERWAEEERVRFRDLAVAASWSLVEELLNEGSWDRARVRAEAATRLVPIDELRVQQLITALAAAGERTQAARFYHTWAAHLQDELELDPSPETAEMVATLLQAEAPTEPASTEPRRPIAESGRHGSTAEGARDGRPAISRRRGRRLAAWLAAAIVVIVTVWVAWRTVEGAREDAAASSGAGGIPTLIVLPFRSIADSSGSAYLAEGMTEMLTSTLAGVRGLRVLSSLTATAYGDPATRLRDIAGELGVDVVIVGGVLRAGDEARITVRMIDARTKEHLWAGTYGGDLSDVLAFTADVARQVASELQVALTPRDEARLGANLITRPKVMDALLRARFLVESGLPTSLDQATRLLEAALEIDPDFAPAWGLLAAAYVSRMAWFGGGEAAVRFRPLADRAARAAITLDRNQPHARMALAELEALDFRWEAADAAFRRVLDRDPSQVMAGVHRANLLLWTGRHQEAERSARELVEVAPLLPAAYEELANILAQTGRLREAFPYLRRSLELDPTSPVARGLAASYLARLGRCEGPGDLLPPGLGIDSPEEEFDELVSELDPLPPIFYSGAILTYLRCGRRDRAAELHAQLEARARTQYVSPAVRARVHAAMGDPERALDFLNEALDSHDAALRTLRYSADFAPLRDALRGDPRLDAIIEAVGLPPLDGRDDPGP
jgi:TolB-like protein/DNA-binding SARP family transcriptional activator/Tfp pilus assembly protein PilF